MPDKHTLIVIHGMGTHSEESIKKEVTDSLDYALNLYDKPGTKQHWKGQSISNLVDIVPFSYDNHFNNWRKQIADASSPMADRINALKAGGILVKAVSELTKWEKDLNADNFFETHWLDVLFYLYTTLAEPIRLDLATKIVDAIEAKPPSKIHILAHSLGTSVLHDTLASLYSPVGVVGDDKNLSPSANKLGSIHMVANVSKLLQSFIGVDASIVNPCGGCTRTYYQYRHILDPFTLPSPFEPVMGDVWSCDFETTPGKYLEIKPKLLTDMNTHSIAHYLENPVCHVPLLKKLGFKFWPSQEQVKKAYKLHKDAKSIQGKAETVQAKWEALDLKNAASVFGFINAAQSLRDLMAEFGETFK